MFSTPVIKKLKLVGTGCSLLILTNYLPLAFSAPNIVNINNEHVYIYTPQSEETLFNVTNGGSLTISNAEAGFTPSPQSHLFSDSTLSLNSNAIFSGDIDSNNSHIIFSDSTYTGNIRPLSSASLGDIYINASVVNGSIRTGQNNHNKTVTIKDDVFNGQGRVSPLSVYSGSLIVENSKLNNHNFAVMDIRNTDSAILQKIDINSTSDYTGAMAIGVTGILLQDVDNVDIMNSVITSDGTAIRMRNSADDGVLDNLFISNSTLSAKAASALEAANSDMIIYNSTLNTASNGDEIACYAGSAAINGCGALHVEGANVFVSQHSVINSNNVGVFITGENKTQFDVSDSSINAQKAVFSVNQGNAAIALRNNYSSGSPSVTSKEGKLLEALNNSQVDFSLYNIYARGDIFADDSSRVNVLLSGASQLEGNITGVGTLEIGRSAQWKMTADNHIKQLLFIGGSILMPDVDPNDKYHTLTIDSLTGAGLFALNTSLQKMQGDMLNITRDLYGTFLLRVANSGAEPDDPDAMLKVVQGPTNTALFALYGGKVDAGVWQYDLIQKDNAWYLANSARPDAPDTPDVPDTPDAPDNPPQPSLTPSADAVLNMAAAPGLIFTNELQNLRQRRGDLRGREAGDGGLWGRYLHQNTRINSATSRWKLGQNGFELGGGKAVAAGQGNLLVGVMASITNNSVRDVRGGNSQIDSYGIGAYASWFADSGLYLDTTIKMNRFNSRLHTRMSDGVAVSGGYNQYGLGGALEGGWHIVLADDYWVEPFARMMVFRADGSQMTLSNGMRAQIYQPSLVQAETGLQMGKRVRLGKAVLDPYLKASVTHGLAKSAKVRLNDRWDFNDAANASAGSYGAGIDISLARDASLYSELTYQKGRAVESPLTANLGFRIGF